MGSALMAEKPSWAGSIVNYILGRTTTHTDSNSVRAGYSANRRRRVEKFQKLFSKFLTVR
jgi:membrane protein YqaA with SNARE-associated domain